MAASRKDLCLPQGSTYSLVIRWENPDQLLYKDVTAVVSQVPLRLTVPAHGIPDGWPVALLGFTGDDVNASKHPPRSSDMHAATVIDPDTIEINDIASLKTLGVAQASLVLFAPRSLVGYTAHMQVRESVESEEALLTLDTTTGGIVMDDLRAKTTVTFVPSDTQGATWQLAVYDIEFESATGDVTRAVEGVIELTKEVTRDAS